MSVTPTQALILWSLLARHGEALQGDLVPAVKKADREALAAQGLVAVEKRGSPFFLTVTDKGWRWAGDHMREPLPPGFRALQDWLMRIEQHLARSGETLATFIGPAPEATAPPPKPTRKRETKKSAAAPKPPGKPVPRKPAAPRPPGPRKLRARIEAAYLTLTGGARAQGVRLSALRAELADIDRATLDAGLARILKGDRSAILSQLSDPKALTPAEREAAYSPAGEPFHLLWIQS
jgi:hypothetical protein